MGPIIDVPPAEYHIYNVSCVAFVVDSHDECQTLLVHGTVRAESPLLAESCMKQFIAKEAFTDLHCVTVDIETIVSYQMPDNMFKADALKGKGHEIFIARLLIESRIVPSK